MSLVHLANVCSHLQNASRARLGPTSVPLTKLHLRLALGLQKQGFISTVQLGGPAPTTMDKLPENRALRRLWLGLKYWNNEPVLSRMTMVSKPTKRIWLNSRDLGTIVRGHHAGLVKGLTRPGECLFVTTDIGILEARECAEKKLGGMVLCRVI